LKSGDVGEKILETLKLKPKTNYENNTSNRYHRRKMCSLVKGDYNTKIIYNENRLKLLKNLKHIEYLHLVDLDEQNQAKL
jgi:hypothetical protein